MTTTVELLNFAKTQPDGLTFGQLQRFVVETNGYDYDERIKVRVWDGKDVVDRQVRRHRGYWCDALCGSSYYGRKGILATHFVKRENKYFLK